MESYKSKPKIFARSKTNIAPNCKKHPKHKQSPGVCSLCVNEKLFQLSNNCNSSRKKVKENPQSASSSSSEISSISSSEPSSCSSPVEKYARRIDSNALKSFKVNGQNAIKKSRSMAFGLRYKKEEKEIKTGFWSKLLKAENKGLMHYKNRRTAKGSLRFAIFRIG